MRHRYQALYRLGLTPWDQHHIPAVLVAAAASQTAGQALDLGCGTGRQARFLAEHGWAVTAVDYIADAIRQARHEDPAHRVDWRVADVTKPSEVDPVGELAGRITLMLDNGCLHGIPDHRRPGWASTVNTMASNGCTLLIRAAPRQWRGIGPSGLSKPELESLLGTCWHEQTTASGWHRYAHTKADMSDSRAV